MAINHTIPNVIYISNANDKLVSNSLEEKYACQLKKFDAKSVEAERFKYSNTLLSSTTTFTARIEAANKLRFFALSHEEEIELFTIIQSKEDSKKQDQARKTVLESVSSTIAAFADKYRLQCKLQERGDLVSYGLLGAQDALEHYNPAKSNGASFSTFANRYIKYAISYGCRLLDSVFNLSPSQWKRINKLLQTKKSFERQFGRTPSVDELKKLLPKYSRVYIFFFKDGLPQNVSIDEPTNSNDMNNSTKFKELIPDHKTNEHDKNSAEELRNYMREKFCLLDERTQTVLKLHFGLDGEQPLKLEEIGKQLDISVQSVSRIEKAGLIQLRAMLTMPESVA